LIKRIIPDIANKRYKFEKKAKSYCKHNWNILRLQDKFKQDKFFIDNFYDFNLFRLLKNI